MTKEEQKMSPKERYQKALDYYSKAMKEYRKGDFQKASELLREFIKNFSSEKELYNRAQLYLSICEEKKKKKVTLKDFDDYYQHSVYKLNRGEYDEALNYADKALEKKPKEGKVYYLKALIFCSRGNKEQCIENLKKAVQLDKFFKVLAQNEVNFEPLKEEKKFNLITKVE